MAIRILTDSTSDIPRSQADQWGLEIAPLKVRIGSEEYIDRVTLMPQEIYEKLTSSDVLPQTSQVNPEEFCRLFQQYREQGDEVVGLFISSYLSGTYQSAVAARHICGEEGIYLTDSRSFASSIREISENSPAVPFPKRRRYPRRTAFTNVADENITSFASTTASLTAALSGTRSRNII